MCGPTFFASLPHEPAADALLLARTQEPRIALHEPLAAAERQIEERAFPRHPHRQRPGILWTRGPAEADAALGRTAGVVVLHAIATEDARAAIVHLDRNREVKLAHRRSQEIPGRFVETEALGDA